MVSVRFCSCEPLGEQIYARRQLSPTIFFTHFSADVLRFTPKLHIKRRLVVKDVNQSLVWCCE